MKKGAKRGIDRSKEQDYDYHLPVMLMEVCDLLTTDKDGWYVDGTLGGGGHTAELLKRLSPKGRVYAFDADPEAIEYCKEKFQSDFAAEQRRFFPMNDNFIQACSIGELQGKAQGLLLDLGVSSRQLDGGVQGISFRSNAPLDMRFGSANSGRTAADFLNESKEEDIERVLRVFGEEPFARTLTRRITQRRRVAPLRTTVALRDVVAETVPPHLLGKTLARVFQALRIEINQELSVLEAVLRCFIPMLKSGGRIVVMSYHSLEDRIVKNIFREYARLEEGQTEPKVKILTPKPMIATDEEIQRNPRARSVKIRAAEKSKD